METVAKAKHIRQSPKKMRPVIDLVRGKSVNEALTLLQFTNKKAANLIRKTIQSAVANMTNNLDHQDVDDLFIKAAYVDGGPVMKRWRAAAMGRAVPIMKRTSHLTIILSDKKK